MRRTIPQRFKISDAGPVRLSQLITQGQFERFAREVGEPAERMALPEPASSPPAGPRTSAR